MKKRFLAGFLSVCIIVGAIAYPVEGSSVMAEENTDVSVGATSGDYSYQELEDGTIKITRYCGNETTLSIPEMIDGKTVTVIGEYAFAHCTGLTDINIPANVTNIGEGAFSGCIKLTTIVVANENTKYATQNGILCNKELTEIICCPGGMTGNINIPDNVLSIGDRAFSFCRGITGISIPDGVTSIGTFAFYYCSGLTSVNIPDSVTNIGGGAFCYCSGLTSVNISDSITNIEMDTFSDCNGLTNINIPNRVKSIEEHAFYGCRGLKEIDLPESLEYIGKYAFYGTALTRLVIPTRLEKIEHDAFNNCSELASITFSGKNNLSYVGKDAFNRTAWMEKQNGDFVELNGMLLLYQGSAEKPIVPDTVTSIEVYAFLKKAGVTEMTVPRTVSKVAYCAFESCTTLENVVVNDGVKSIGESAFINCGNIKNITIPKSVETIEKRAIGYEYDWNNNTYEYEFKKTSSLPTIQCYKDSVAYNYAVENGIPYKLLAEQTYTHTHTYITTTVKATTSKNGSITKKCTVCGNIASKTTIYYPKTITLSKTSYIYNGKAQKPSVTVKDSKGKKLKKGTDYTVSYASGCKNVGRYTVTIKFKGNYSGTVKKTFTIQPEATSLSKLTAKSKGFTVKWKKLTSQATGYEIQYSTSSKFTTKTTKTVTVSKNKTTSKSISKLKAKKKYYVRIRTYKTVKVNGKSTKMYSNWSKAKTVTTKK